MDTVPKYLLLMESDTFMRKTFYNTIITPSARVYNIATADKTFIQ